MVDSTKYIKSISNNLYKLPKKNSFFRRLNKLGMPLSLKGDERIMEYFRWIARDDLVRLFNDDLKNALKFNKAEAEYPFYNFLKSLPQNLSPLEKLLLLEQRFFLSDHNLIYTDKMSMAAGVEVRLPFLDTDLVEFA